METGLVVATVLPDQRAGGWAAGSGGGADRDSACLFVA